MTGGQSEMHDDIYSLRDRIGDLEDIHRLAHSLGSILNVYEMLETIGDCCRRICGAEHMAIVLLSPAVEDTALTLVRNTLPEDNRDYHPVHKLAAGWVAYHKTHLLTDNIVAELNVKNPHESMRQLRSLLAFPIKIEEKPVAAIVIYNEKKQRRFTESDVRLIEAIAPLAALFLQRAKVLESITRHSRTLHRQRMNFLLGESSAMKNVKGKISIVAPTNATVLLIGETGTGKEMAASAIHYQSKRADGPFIAVNCAAIPATLVESELFGHEKGSFTGATEMRKGKFELAHKGTLFLDEISAMPLDLQPKLLRVLEDRSFSRIGASAPVSVDVRVIAATNIDLIEASRRGDFREDLYHRLNVVPISLPSLREQADDIPLLAQSFLNEFSGGTKKFTDEALEGLKKHEWRGNVRELRNVVERIFIFTPSSTITVKHLSMAGVTKEGETGNQLQSILHNLLHTKAENVNLLELLEREIVDLALRISENNITKAAQLLGIDRNALSRRIEKYGLKS
jgi:transcriptional regulator with GAF, ATPase, and Fis domain